MNMNRREFFGAGAGLALGAAGVKTKEKHLGHEEWLDEYQSWYADYKPELELGHSARWKIQRYPGAKWTPLHRSEEHFWYGTNGTNKHPSIEGIDPIITNCIMGS